MSLSNLDAAHFTAIIENSSDAIISKELDGTVQTWNRAAERLFGWTAAEMVGQSIRRIMPEDRQNEEDSILARVEAGERIPRFQTIRQTKSGERIPIAVTVSPIRDDAGRIVGASKIANDMRQQAQLRETREQFTALADNIPQLAWLADGEGWIYWYNQRWYTFTGTSLTEMAGWGWQAVHHPDHLDRVTRHFKDALETGEPWEDTFPLRRHDGVFRWFLSRANPLRDETGKVILWCGTNTDVTEQREAGDRIALLMQEVNHRSRNMLATVQAIINRSANLSNDQLAVSLKSRIRALAQNQELLNGGDWSGARIADIVSTQTIHVVDPGHDAIFFGGSDDLILKAPAAEALGLAIHELATNAQKHGALRSPEGRVDVDWKVTSEAGEKRLVITWRERGGPPVSAPARNGFGTLLIARNVEQAFGAPVILDWNAGGLTWRATAPAERVLAETIDDVQALSAFGPGIASEGVAGEVAPD